MCEERPRCLSVVDCETHGRCIVYQHAQCHARGPIRLTVVHKPNMTVKTMPLYNGLPRSVLDFGTQCGGLEGNPQEFIGHQHLPCPVHGDRW